MVTQIERSFGEKFLKSIDNFYTYGIDWLFNEWWETAPADVIAKYEAAILDHPDHGPLAREGWLAPDFRIGSLDSYGPGTLGHAYRTFMVDNNLVEHLAAGYRGDARQPGPAPLTGGGGQHPLSRLPGCQQRNQQCRSQWWRY